MSAFAPISVAISTLERPESLEGCLRALGSGERLPAEIVIVDQSRDARTRTLVETLKSPIELRYVPQAARGLAKAQNEAVRSARQPIVAVTDDDCIPDPRWIAVLERIFAAPDAPDVVTGRVLPLPAVADRTSPVSSRTDERRVEFDPSAMPWRIGSGNNFALRREAYLRIGGCDERLGPGSPGLGGVDMDLFHRLLRSGAVVRYEPDNLVLHERQTEEGRRSRRWMYGHGMGACATLRAREGDRRAPALLARWIGFRFARLVRGAATADFGRVDEEIRVLGGTARGIVYGLRAPRSAESPADDTRDPR